MRDSALIGSTQVQFTYAVSEQTQYQQAVFRTLLKWVSFICSLLGVAYLIPFLQLGAWSSLIICLNMWTVTVYSLLAIRYMHGANFSTLVRGWLALATWTVCTFGLLQSNEFINIMAL